MQIKFFEILLDFYFIFVYKYPYIGWVAEWLKAHAWKVCLGRKPNGGSNPLPSAKEKPIIYDGIFIYYSCRFFSKSHFGPSDVVFPHPSF